MKISLSGFGTRANNNAHCRMQNAECRKCHLELKSRKEKTAAIGLQGNGYCSNLLLAS